MNAKEWRRTERYVRFRKWRGDWLAGDPGRVYEHREAPMPIPVSLPSPATVALAEARAQRLPTVVVRRPSWWSRMLRWLGRLAERMRRRRI